MLQDQYGIHDLLPTHVDHYMYVSLPVVRRDLYTYIFVYAMDTVHMC